jgi:hypothetical protein
LTIARPGAFGQQKNRPFRAGRSCRARTTGNSHAAGPPLVRRFAPTDAGAEALALLAVHHFDRGFPRLGELLAAAKELPLPLAAIRPGYDALGWTDKDFPTTCRSADRFG